MSQHSRLISPLDVLMLRGNKSFGESGEHGASQMPPSPSVISGALRSFWLAEQQVDVRDFANAKRESLSEPVLSQLGTPADPGTFRLSHTGLVRQKSKGIYERLFPVPSDLVLQKRKKEDNVPVIYGLQPQSLPEGLMSGLPANSRIAVLKAPPGKPESGYWLSEEGFIKYLNGNKPDASHLLKSSDLWKSDWRLGIALETRQRTASEGQLYTTEAIALAEHIHLLAEISGAADFPAEGLLRLGGDGRSAHFTSIDIKPFPVITPKHGRIKLLLTSPAIFPNGSQLPGQTADGRIGFTGGSARVVAASIPRNHVVSGWDLANWQPKPAERVVPAGAVFWLEDVQFNGASLRNALQELLLSHLDAQRQAEGFNACLPAAWMN